MSSIQTASTIGTAAAPFPWFDFNDAVAAPPRLQKEDIRARLLDQLESALAYLLPRGDVVTKEYVDQWLHLIKANGEYQRIVGRWLN